MMHYTIQKAQVSDYMKSNKDEIEKIRLAVQRLMESGGSCSPNNISDAINESMEIEGLILGIQHGQIVKTDDRIFVAPSLCYSIMCTGGVN